MTWWVTNNKSSENLRRNKFKSLYSFVELSLYEKGNFFLHKLLAWQYFRVIEHQIRRKSGIRIIVQFSVKIKEVQNIPALAWVGHQHQGGWDFKLGPKVEKTSFGFYEGVWDADFDSTTPVSSSAAFGSGVMQNYPSTDALCVLTPKSPYEQVWVLQNTQATFVSNSLAFILQEADIRPESKLAKYINDNLVLDTFSQGRVGIDRGRVLFAELEEWKFFRFIYFDFTIDRHGKIRRLWQNPQKLPSSYSIYSQFLRDTLNRIMVNASDGGRKTQFSPLTSLSSGYDSTAVASLAQELPDLKAVTLDVKVLDIDDNGIKIAESLRIPVTAYSHVISNTIDNLRFDFDGQLLEAAKEFLGTAGIGDDVNFLAFEPSLANTFFLTGNYGDSVWSRVSKVQPGLSLATPFGKSLNEFRLRVGFVHVPVPVIGARFIRVIKGISNSEAMQSWSVGGTYDRPIPRRLGEDAGVPREAFGISKAATAPLALNHHEKFPDALSRMRERYKNKED